MLRLVTALRHAWRFLANNPKLFAGAALLSSLLFISIIGPLFVDIQLAQPLSVVPNKPPSSANFVGATSGAVLAGIGLEVLGLGPQDTPSLGMTIYWALLYAAFSRGMWWWWAPPIAVLIILFVGLFIISVALDEFANPRLGRRI